MSDTANVRIGIQFGVSAEQETLADYLRRVIRDKDLSYRKVAQASGGRVSHATISDIINGNQKDVKTETLRGLAQGLRVAEDELFAVARGKSLGDSESFDGEVAAMFTGYQELSEADKKELLPTARMFAADIQRRLSAARSALGSKPLEELQGLQEEVDKQGKKAPDGESRRKSGAKR